MVVFVGCVSKQLSGIRVSGIPCVAERPLSRQAFDTFSYGSVRHVPIYLMEV